MVDARGDFWRRPKPMAKIVPESSRPPSYSVPEWNALNSAGRRQAWRELEAIRAGNPDLPPAVAEALPPEEESKDAKLPVASRDPDADAAPASIASTCQFICGDRNCPSCHDKFLDKPVADALAAEWKHQTIQQGKAEASARVSGVSPVTPAAPSAEPLAPLPLV